MLTRIFCDVDDFCQTFEPESHRFTELMPMALIALCAFMKSRYGQPIGIIH